MSGGSFNYVSTKDPTDLLENPNLDEALEWMHDRLSELGYAEAAAADTLEFLQRLRAVRQFIPTLTDNNLIPQFYALQKIWQAVEWWDSLDGSEEQVREAVANYPQERTTKADEALVHISLPANVVAALLSHIQFWQSQPPGWDNLLEQAAESMEAALTRQGLEEQPDTGRQRSSGQGKSNPDRYYQSEPEEFPPDEAIQR